MRSEWAMFEERGVRIGSAQRLLKCQLAAVWEWMYLLAPRCTLKTHVDRWDPDHEGSFDLRSGILNFQAVRELGGGWAIWVRENR